MREQMLWPESQRMNDLLNKTSQALLVFSIFQSCFLRHKCSDEFKLEKKILLKRRISDGIWKNFEESKSQLGLKNNNNIFIQENSFLSNVVRGGNLLKKNWK